jgi:hypothetical protein
MIVLFYYPNDNLDAQKFQSPKVTITINAEIPKVIDNVYAFDVIVDKNDFVFFCKENQLMQIKSNLPDETLSYELALHQLEKYGGLPDDAKLNNFEYVSLKKINESSMEIVEKYPLWSAIKFKRTLNKMPVVGPGGEIDISLGEEGELLGITKIWRSVIGENKVKTISPETAIEELYSGNTINKLQTSTNITITKIELGYYELGAGQIQDVIKPVWIFSGYSENNDYMYLCVDAENKSELDLPLVDL